MKYISIILGVLATSLFSNQASAQEKPKEWDASIYGWVRTDYNIDSRQSAYVREYNLNLYPLDEKLDKNGKDVNATGASNFLAITSRVGINFRGPDVWGAKATGKIEGDFFGNTELNKASGGSGSIGLFRLRHATANLDWGKTAVIFGQTWYPTFIPEVFPGVANFSTGIMFNPFGWVGQVRVNHKITPELSVSAIAYKDREFTTPNAANASSNSATFNSTIPTFHGQLQYKNKTIIAGVGAEYQSLKPTIDNGGATTAALVQSDESLNSTTFLAYFKYSNAKFSAKLYGISGGNLHHLVMLGGFAGYAKTDGTESYKPVKTSAFWVDLASNNAKIAPGLFFGYTKNGGTDEGYTNLYVRGAATAMGAASTKPTRVIANIWRASARVDFKQNKFKITPELEYTTAKWANIKTDGTAGDNAIQVGNVRALLSVIYSF